MASTPPSPPLRVNILQQYLLVLRCLRYLLDAAESSQAGLDGFLAAAEWRYTLFLDALKREALVPPWDVAIIWHAHLMFPYIYLADVVHRPAYSDIPKSHLNFPLDSLASLIAEQSWCDPRSAQIWKDIYPNIPYQLWPGVPMHNNASHELIVGDVLVSCADTACNAPIRLSVTSLIQIQAAKHILECVTCGNRSSKEDICFQNLRSDWQTALADEGHNSAIAIKGATLDRTGQLFEPNRMGPWIQKWATQCVKEVNEDAPLDRMDAALKLLPEHAAPADQSLVSILQKDIQRAYENNIWPSLSVDLVAFAKRPQVMDLTFFSKNSLAENEALPLALQRYVQYIHLRRKGWGMYLHPDIRFVQNCHKLLPVSYHRWCEDHIGERLLPGPGSPIDNSLQTPQARRRTELLWEAEYGEPYSPLNSGDDILHRESEESDSEDSKGEGDSSEYSFGKPLLYQRALQGPSIRLLHFKRKSGAGIPHYDLTEHTLANIKEYCALSYTWESPYFRESDGEMDDSPTEENVICCNNILIPVLANAYAFLERLSIDFPEVDFWMDCICINQDDNVEKSEQVSQMGRIYTCASRVIVWLGPDHHLLEDYRWACTTFRLRHREMGRTKRTGHSLVDKDFWEAAGVSNLWHRFRNATLFEAVCRWFGRTWIVQEGILAADICVLCGSTQLPWFGMVWLGRQFSVSTPTPPDGVAPEALNHARPIGSQARQIQAHRGQLVKLRASDWTTMSEESRFLSILVGLIEAFRSTECSDPRDKVYAMLGIARSKVISLSPAVSGIIPVDYSTLDWQDVYYAFAKASIEHRSNLEILNFVQLTGLQDDDDEDVDDDEQEEEEEDRPVGLPSWVPDFSWSHNVSAIHLRVQYDDTFLVWGPDKRLHEKARVQGRELLVRGIKLDDISVRLPESERPLPFLDWFELSRASVTRDPSSSRIESLISAATVCNIRRTLPAWNLALIKQGFFSFVQRIFGLALWEAEKQNHNHDDGRDYDTVFQEIQHALRNFEPEIQNAELPDMNAILQVKKWQAILESPNSSEAEKQAARASNFDNEKAGMVFAHSVERSRTLFRTKTGSLGLGSLLLEAGDHGDQVWMLAGADVPFILRPVEAGKQQSRTFMLVGACYVHGYMHGEKVAENADVAEELEAIVIL